VKSITNLLCFVHFTWRVFCVLYDCIKIATLVPMLQRIVFSCVLLALSTFLGAQAQEVDLRKLREKPDSNATKIKIPELAVVQMPLSASSLELKVNYWRHITTFSINANQSSFTSNWKGGGISSISVGTHVNHKSTYSKNDVNYVADIQMNYGQMKNKGQTARKNQDRLLIDNKLSFTIFKNWSLFTSMIFESQFDAGYQYHKRSNGRDSLVLMTHFMAPGSITESFGLQFSKDKTFSLRIGTGTARQTFILDDRLVPTAQTGPRFGIEPGKRFRNDLAFQITTTWDKNLGKNFNVSGRYNLFANYKEISDPEHALEVYFITKITNLINVRIEGRALYNSRVDSKIQANQNIGLGLSYRLPR
jgi:hypothetical protein